MLDRRRREYRNVGWVYAVRNPALKDPVFKVGETSRFPTERAQELSSETGVLGKFELVYFIHAADRLAAEHHAHGLLAEHRVSQSKEFFAAPLGAILKALDSAAGQYPVWIGARDPWPLPQPFLSYSGDCTSCGRKTWVRELLVPVRARCGHCGGEVGPDQS
jgi:hypothetical protein